jgi:predicted ferric reductase
MMQGLLRVGLYVLIVIFPLIVALFYGGADQNFLANLSRGFALVGITILALQSVIAGRYKWITRAFGFDITIRYHRDISVFACFLLLLHPLLLASGPAGWSLLLNLSWVILMGKIALALLLANVLVSLFQSRLKLKFERWRFAHDLLGPAILVFAFAHSWFVGADLTALPVQILWVVLLTVTVTAFAHHRLIRPRLLARAPYRVTAVEQEAETVWTIKLAPPPKTRVFDFLPGQFHFVTFLRGRDLPTEEHHWTIASSPTEKDHLSTTIKELGDFTATIKETRPDDRAVVHGPFGRFSYLLHPEEKRFVFVAGGIGITPLMSMLRHMRDQKEKRPVTLIYGNPDRKSIVFYGELAEIERDNNLSLKVVHVLQNPPPEWSGESGFIDQETIAKHLERQELEGVVSDTGYYVVGPPPMLENVCGYLRALGITDNRIHMEIFSFLD